MMLRTLLLLLTYLATMTSGYAFVGDESEETEKRFLGISSDFGRWESGLIRWGYNPTNAPAAYSDASNTVAIIQRAMDEWSNVSGLQFEFQGASSGWDSENRDDQVVAVTWSGTLDQSVLGQAGPRWSTSDSDYQGRGYPFYSDGSFYLNLTSDWDDDKLESTTLHELGHLIGLGHSDNPDSVMYANPYNHLRHLRNDDISAVQVLYGKPTQLQRVAPEGLTTVVRDERITATAKIPASGENSEVVLFSDDASATTVVISSVHAGAAPEFVWGVFADDERVQHTYDRIYTDPQGYQYESSPHVVDCNPPVGASGTCFLTVTGSLTADILRTQPGTWSIDLRLSGVTKHRMQIEVADDLVWNQAPQGRLQLDQAINFAAMSVTAQLDVSDSESDPVSATWHYPGLSTAPTSLTADASDQQTITLNEATDSYLFVVLDDPNGRYTNSGDGFRSLVRHPMVVMEAPGAGTPTDLAVSQRLVSAAESTDTIQLAVDISNQGTVSADELTVKVIIPQAVYLSEPLPAGCSANAERDLVSCQLASLAADASHTLQFQLSSDSQNDPLWSYAGVVSTQNGDASLMNNVAKIDLTAPPQVAGDSSDTVRDSTTLSTMSGSWNGLHDSSDQLQISIDSTGTAQYQISWGENGNVVNRNGQLFYQGVSDNHNSTGVARYQLVLDQSSEAGVFAGEAWYLYLQNPLADTSDSNRYQVTVYRDQDQNELRLWRRAELSYPYLCTGSAAELTTAFSDVVSSQIDHATVRMQSGNYSGNFVFQQPFVEHQLTLQGGYGPGCASQSGQGTILDGGGNGSTLLFNAYDATGSLTLQDLTLQNGGGVQSGGALKANSWGNNGKGDVVLERVLIRDSSSTMNGGGVYVAAASVTLDQVQISGNSTTADGYGAGAYLNSETVTISRSVWERNGSDSAANDHGGALYLGNSVRQVSITDSHFSENGAAVSGGAIYANVSSGAHFEFKRNVVNGNRSGSASDGFGTFTGAAGLRLEGFDSAVLVNNQFTANQSVTDAGAIYSENVDELLVLNNTIAYNSAYATGGGLYIESDEDDIQIRNNLLWHNVGGGSDTNTMTGTNGVDLKLVKATNASFSAGSILVSENLLLPSDSALYGGRAPQSINLTATSQNNITQDPLLIADASDFLHLSAASPALDAGNLSGLDASDVPIMDLLGQLRVLGSAVDLGAVEGSLLPADSSDSGVGGDSTDSTLGGVQFDSTDSFHGHWVQQDGSGTLSFDGVNLQYQLDQDGDQVADEQGTLTLLMAGTGAGVSSKNRLQLTDGSGSSLLYDSSDGLTPLSDYQQFIYLDSSDNSRVLNFWMESDATDSSESQPPSQESTDTLVSWNLESGWNLVGMPVESTDSLNTLLNSATDTILSVWYYNGADATESWSYFIADATSTATLTTLEGGKSYWVRLAAESSTQIQWSGQSPASLPPLVTGWNMRAPIDGIDTLSTLSAVNGVQSIWGWSAEQWQSYSAGTPQFLNSLQQVEMGRGYYLYRE